MTRAVATPNLITQRQSPEVNAPGDTERFRAYGLRDLADIGARFGIDSALVDEMSTVARVLPFRVNEYVLTHLIDWDNIPEDPMFQLLFPQPGMLADEARSKVLKRVASSPKALVTTGTGGAHAQVITDIRLSLRPHPSGQREFNIPSTKNGQPIEGLQHKYERTILYFPANGQTCHSYCTFCFRWAQFTNEHSLRFAARGPGPTVDYLRDHPQVTDVLVTGGDPMVMSERRLREHLLPFLQVDTIETIRIGTKSLAFWPYRVLTDPDADATLALLGEIVDSGRAVAWMAQFTHPRELENDLVQAAIHRLHSVGVEIYAQAPLIRGVNDDPLIWERMWRQETSLGITPYYMFVARETGPHDYFKVPLVRASEIYEAAYRNLPGIARTVRGPVMSATAGKIVIDGLADLAGDQWFHLRFLQARDQTLVGRPFLAKTSEDASWITDLTAHPDTPADLVSAMNMDT